MMEGAPRWALLTGAMDMALLTGLLYGLMAGRMLYQAWGRGRARGRAKARAAAAAAAGTSDGGASGGVGRRWCTALARTGLGLACQAAAMTQLGAAALAGGAMATRGGRRPTHRGTGGYNRDRAKGPRRRHRAAAVRALALLAWAAYAYTICNLPTLVGAMATPGRTGEETPGALEAALAERREDLVERIVGGNDEGGEQAEGGEREADPRTASSSGG